MGLLTEGYNLAMDQYRLLMRSKGAISNIENEVNSVESTTSSDATTSTKDTVSSTNTEEKVTFEELLTSNKVTSEETYNVYGYNITIPSLSNSKVKEAISQYNIDSIITKASEKYNIPEALIYKVIETESYFNNDCVSSVGATGLMQIMPFNNSYLGITDATDPYQNIMGGVKLLKQYIDMYDGDVKLGLAAYNAGPGNVNKYNGVPPFKETQNYIRKILGVEP